MPLVSQTTKSTKSVSLPDIVPAIRMLSAFDKLKLIRILAEELENAKDFFPFESGKTYQMVTPYNMFGAADIMAKTIYQDAKV